ncbi:OmpA family protein [Spirosoma pulveris]
MKTRAIVVRSKCSYALTSWLLFLLACSHTDVLAQQQPQSGTMLPLSVTILYFDQSSPALRPGVKTTLDSLAQLLVRQPTLVAAITGYTDNVGKRELNLALAEHRAKGVADYLKQHGVNKGRIVVNWEGPGRNASRDQAAPVATIDRRVVIQLLPR